MSTTNSLTISTQGVKQRQHTLVCDQEISCAYEFTEQDFLDYDIKSYMEKFGNSATAEIAAKVCANVNLNFETNTYRFYDGISTPITTSGQLVKALRLFRNFGAVQGMADCILDDMTMPDVVNSNLAQFVTSRNDKEANSWEVGEMSKCKFYEDQLLPVHTAGTEGQAGSTLTVVSTTKNSEGAITAITFSGCDSASDADSVKAYDKFQFNDGVSGYTNVRFVRWFGHQATQSPCQFSATVDAESTAGSQVTVTVNPPLQPTAGAEQNINVDIVAGMQVSVLPSHRCGVIMAGNPLFLAMPQMGNKTPYPSSNSIDPDSGISLRTYYGSAYGIPNDGIVHDGRWGSTLVGDYAMMVALPVS
jgi:hypothetical protein